MQLSKVSDDLSDPAATGWSSLPTKDVTLEPVPIEAQPTEYIRVKWADGGYGSVREVHVAGAHNGTDAFIRLEWADSEEPNTEFHDAAAVYFPANGGDSPAATIGTEDAPVNLWYWQANLAGPRDLVATGPGRFRPRGTAQLRSSASLDEGRWAVVLARPLEDVTRAGCLGIAVWDGSNEERAGVGSSTPGWLPLNIEEN